MQILRENAEKRTKAGTVAGEGRHDRDLVHLEVFFAPLLAFKTVQ